MKKSFFTFGVALLLAAGNSSAQVIANFDSLKLWAGDGQSATNRAGLVLQWNLGPGPYQPVSLAWGYGWNSGTPTGWDMLQAVAAFDPRLSVVAHPDFDSVFGIYYDAQDNGTGFVSGLPEDKGGPEDGVANDSGNYYLEGWFTGFWEYSVFGGNFSYDVYSGPPTYVYLETVDYNQAGSQNYTDVVWINAGIGSNNRDLQNGYWDNYSFAPGFASQLLIDPIAAPEPSSFLMLFGLGSLAFLRRKKKS